MFKLLQIACVVLGCLVVLGSTSSLTDGDFGEFLFALLSGLAIIAFGLRKFILKFINRNKLPDFPEKSLNLPKTFTKSSFGNEVSERFEFNVAGVTFKNDDGTNRQKLISKMEDGEKLNLTPYLYQGKPAVYVLNEDEKIIGNVPKELCSDIFHLLQADNAEPIFEATIVGGYDGKNFGVVAEGIVAIIPPIGKSAVDQQQTNHQAKDVLKNTESPSPSNYVASKNSKTFHWAGCSYIKHDQIARRFKTKGEANSAGYKQCKHCSKY